MVMFFSLFIILNFPYFFRFIVPSVERVIDIGPELTNKIEYTFLTKKIGIRTEQRSKNRKQTHEQEQKLNSKKNSNRNFLRHETSNIFCS